MAKLETLIDDFSDNDLSPLWVAGDTGNVTGYAQEENGQLELAVESAATAEPATPTHVYIESAGTYDLTDSYAYVRIVQPTNSGEGHPIKRDSRWYILIDSTHWVQWRTLDGASGWALNVIVRDGGPAANAYNHLGGFEAGETDWLKIHHESATDEIVFSYAADAGGAPFEWVEALRMANPYSDITAVSVRFEVARVTGSSEGGTPARPAYWDNFNTSAPASPLPFIFGFGHIGDISHAIGSGSFTLTTGNATVAVEPATSRRMLRLSGSSDSILRAIPNATELVLGFRFRATAFGTEVPIVTFLPAGGGAIASLGISADGYLQVKRSTTLLQGQALDPLEAGAEYYVEISAALESAGDFEVRVHQHETQLFSFGGSNRNLGGVAGGCERIRFSGIPNAFVWITDVYLDDRAGGAGTGFLGPGVVDFYPADDADLGEVPDDGDTTHVDMLDGDVEQHATLPAAGGGQKIHAVAAFTVARLPNSGPLTIRMGLLSDGVPAAVGVRKPGDTAYAGLTSAAAKIDPQTGQPWTQAALADVEVYLKAEEE